MCGIVGYTGPQSASHPLIEGLRRLEYRGYDSAGIALGTAGKLFIEKKAGKLSNLESALDASLPNVHSGIGHTRWATHGGPTDRNAHPHVDNEGKLAVIHNGIIENYTELRSQLEAKGHKFSSETDTESVAHLLSDLRKEHNGDLTAAMRDAVKALRGSFTLLAIHADQPDVVVGVRRNSPLVVGLGDGENFMASDVAAFIEFTKRAIELGQDEVVTMTPTSVEITDLDGKVVTPKGYEISWDASAAQKGGFAHFMLKEIFEQPIALANTLEGRISEGHVLESFLGPKAAELLAKHLDPFIESQRQELYSSLSSIQRRVTQLSNATLIAGLVTLILGVVVVRLLLKSIVRPIEQATEALSAGARQTNAAAAEISAASQSLANAVIATISGR